MESLCAHEEHVRTWATCAHSTESPFCALHLFFYINWLLLEDIETLPNHPGCFQYAPAALQRLQSGFFDGS